MEELLVQLERLAQAFPWERVGLEINREPEGALFCRVWLKGSAKMDQDYLSSEGESLTEAVDNAIRDHQDRRDPNRAREKKIAQLKEQIAQLETAIFSLPPYRPNRELCERNPVLKNYRSTIQAPIEV